MTIKRKPGNSDKKRIRIYIWGKQLHEAEPGQCGVKLATHLACTYCWGPRPKNLVACPRRSSLWPESNCSIAKLGDPDFQDAGGAVRCPSLGESWWIDVLWSEIYPERFGDTSEMCAGLAPVSGSPLRSRLRPAPPALLTAECPMDASL